MGSPKDKRSILSAQINVVGIVVLTLLTCIVSSTSAMLCPIECLCSVHGITILVDCSDRQLKTLPEFDPAMEVKITNIPSSKNTGWTISN